MTALLPCAWARAPRGLGPGKSESVPRAADSQRKEKVQNWCLRDERAQNAEGGRARLLLHSSGGAADGLVHVRVTRG